MKRLMLENSFKKDLKLAQKRGRDLNKLTPIINALRKGESLAFRYKNHKLMGSYQGFWECHITPDWLLVYSITETELFLSRTGSHADLFK